MVKNGYLSDLANSVLVSVENEDREKGAALQQRLTAEIDSILQQNMLEGAVLSQTVDDDPEPVSYTHLYVYKRQQDAGGRVNMKLPDI